jgi:hypothetical protein
MATSTSKTSKSVKTVKTLATYKAEFDKISNEMDGKIRKLESAKVDAQSKLVAEMSIKGGYSDVAIADALGLTNDYVGKLVARGVMVQVGLDGVDGYKLLTTQGNKVTVGAIKKLSAGNRKVAEIKSDLVAMGVPERNTKKRAGAAGKKKVAPIVKVKTTLDAWVKSAIAGKMDKYELGALLDAAIIALDPMDD